MSIHKMVKAIQTESKNHMAMYDKSASKHFARAIGSGLIALVATASMVENMGLYGFFAGGKKELENVNDCLNNIDE